MKQKVISVCAQGAKAWSQAVSPPTTEERRVLGKMGNKKKFLQDLVFSVELHVGLIPYPLTHDPYPLSIAVFNCHLAKFKVFRALHSGRFWVVGDH